MTLRLGDGRPQVRAGLCLALPDGQVAPDPCLGLGVCAVLPGHGRHAPGHRRGVPGCTRPVRRRVELVEGLQPDPAGLGHGHAFGDQGHQRSLNRLRALHDVVDVRVHQRGGDQERSVDVLGPLVAPHVVGGSGWRHRVEQPRQSAGPLAEGAVQLTHHEGPGPTVEDAPRGHPVRPPVHQTAHGAPSSHACRDQLLVQAVLERDDGPGGREPRRQCVEGVGRVLRLDRQEHQVQRPAGLRELGRGEGPGRRAPRAVRRLDGEPVGVHRRDVVGGLVHQQHVVARPGQRGAGDAADGSSAVDRDRHGPLLTTGAQERQRDAGASGPRSRHAPSGLSHDTRSKAPPIRPQLNCRSLIRSARTAPSAPSSKTTTIGQDSASNTFRSP